VAGWAADILNQQFIAPFCRLNFGDTDEMPWFQPARKEAKDAKAMADRDKVLLDAGVEMPKAWFYERHEIPMPAAGDDVIGKPAPAPGAFGLDPNGNPMMPGGQIGKQKAEIGKQQPVQAMDAVASSDWRKQALAEAMGVVPEWLTPLEALFAGLATALQDKSKSDAEVLAWVEKAAREFPQKFENMDLGMLAKRLEAAMGAAVVAGVQEAVQ